MKYYIGIDLGTSSTKCVLIDENNKIVKSETVEYKIYQPKELFVEQNPTDWLNAIEKIIYNFSDGIENDIYGLSVAGQMHGLVTIDINGNVVRPCILWNDGRSEKETQFLNNVIGRENLRKYTGNIAFAGFTAPKILWMQTNEPKLWEKVSKIMLPKDFIVFMLTGAFSTDFSDASGTLLLDVQKKCWSKEMLDICHIDKNQLPELHESFDVVGVMKEKYKLPNCKVYAGGGDNACSAISTGTIENGNCNISLGTSGTIFISSDNYIEDATNALHSFCHVNGKYHLLACILSGASARKWWLEEILNSENYSNDEIVVTNKQTDVIFLPYLCGERSPHNDPFATGAFLNLKSTSTRADLSLAVLEGVAFAFRECLEKAKEDGLFVRKSSICGGGAKSDAWCQIISNILNIEIYRLKENAGASLGAALLAKGIYENNAIFVDKIFKPVNPEFYNEKYNKFKKAYRILKDL